MTPDLSRRQFGRLFAGTVAGATLLQMGRGAARAAPAGGYKAMVGVFLFGGNDGWNMVVPTDKRYAAYASMRGSGIALDQGSLVPLAGADYGLHPSLAPLKTAWEAGALNVVLNAGTLHVPLTKAQFIAQPELRPSDLMSHAHEQYHWQGLRARDLNTDGFFGRVHDRAAETAIPALISFAGSDLILAGARGQSLIMPSAGAIVQAGASANSADPAVFARNAAMTALGASNGFGAVADTTAAQITDAYRQSGIANGILTAAGSGVDRYFVDANGAALNSDIARQLLRTARMIEARGTLGHSRQSFFVSQGGYDTHSSQKVPHAALLADLGAALAAFYNALKAMGLAESVTTFTMSDFGRVYKGNGTDGTDHGWGNIHLVMGGPLKGKQVIGAYPTLTFSGESDGDVDGRWIPTIASEEYLSAIARWHGVADADLPYVFPNWQTWSTSGRGPIEMFRT